MSKPVSPFFKLIREQLAGRAGEMRAFTKHWGTVGASSEEALRDMLRRFLPSRYAVSSGIVVAPEVVHDFDPETDPGSRQVDVLIYDCVENVPLVEYGGLAVLVPEAAAAAIECKDSRDYDDVWVSFRNIQSVRRLDPSIVGMVFGYQWLTPSAVWRRINAHRTDLDRHTVPHYVACLAGRFCVCWNQVESQLEFYRLGEGLLAHFWSTLLGLLQGRRGLPSPGLKRMQQALMPGTLEPVLEPIRVD